MKRIDKITWVYNLLGSNALEALGRGEISIPPPVLKQGFSDPRFLCLHGSIGAPRGCINPRDANYWRLIETNSVVEVAVETSAGVQIEWRPISPDHEVARYARTRWYPFTLNGIKLVSALLFTLAPNFVSPVLIIRNRYGLIDLVYDAHEEFEIDWSPPTRAEWEQCIHRLLGMRAMITEWGYELLFTEPETLTACGVVYEISPFEGEWSLYDGVVEESHLLWRGTGIRDDYADLCLCFEESDVGWLVEKLERFCIQNGIRLLKGIDWKIELEFDEQSNEIFPPENYEVIVE